MTLYGVNVATNRTRTADDATEITKSDTTTYSPALNALYVGGAGHITVRTLKGNVRLFSNVPEGSVLPISCTQVLSTGTTATLIVGLHD